METKTANLRIAKLPRKTLAYIQHTGPYRGDTRLFERLFLQVSTWVKNRGMNLPVHEAITVYHDDAGRVPEDKQRISVGYTVPDDTIGTGNIEIMEIPAGEYVIGSFEIPAESYGEAWSETMRFIQEHKYAPSGIMYESYKNDPRTHPEGMHQVEICIGVTL